MIRELSADRYRAKEFRDSGYWDGSTSYQHLSASTAATPDKLAIIDRRGSLTYAELSEAVATAASALSGLGVGVGDVISWQLPNWREGTILHLAAVRMGAISNPIVPIYRTRELTFILDKAKSKVLVVPDVFRGFEYAAMAQEIIDSSDGPCSLVTVGSPPRGSLSWDDMMAGGRDPLPEADQRGVRISLLQFTSGTTADAKGVLHSNDTMSWEARSYSEVWGVRATDVALTISPISHMAGLLAGVFVPILHGMTSVYLDTWDAAQAIGLIEKHRCTVASGAAPFLAGIVNSTARGQHDIKSFRFFGVGGSDVPPALVRAAEQIGVVAARSYGCTECPTISAGSEAEALDVRAQTDGVLQPGVKIKVVAEDGSQVPAGEEGEFVVDAPMRMIGYLDPAHEEGVLDEDGWFHTGDLGVMEQSGLLRVTGRSKDIIIRGGENLSAKEIEDVLYEDPRVTLAAVVGTPDPVLGERVIAFVVVDADNDPSQELLNRVAASGLAKQKIPEQVHVIDEMPMTASGKIQKFKLGDRIGAESTRPASEKDQP